MAEIKEGIKYKTVKLNNIFIDMYIFSAVLAALKDHAVWIQVAFRRGDGCISYFKLLFFKCQTGDPAAIGTVIW